MEPSSSDVQIVAARRDLPLRIRPRVPLSDDALFEFCQRNRDLRIERTSEGDLIVMSPTGAETGRRNFTLTSLFGAWVVRDGTGVGFDSSTGFVLPNGAERAPDVAWLRKSRWEALTVEQRRRFAPLCPDFVIELRSPSDDLEELHAKMREYADNGAALGWLIDPDAKRVWVYRPGEEPEALEAPPTLTGEPVLPGFVLDLAAIW
jgi:Uma2 family endonuclease